VKNRVEFQKLHSLFSFLQRISHNLYTVAYEFSSVGSGAEDVQGHLMTPCSAGLLIDRLNLAEQAEVTRDVALEWVECSSNAIIGYKLLHGEGVSCGVVLMKRFLLSKSRPLLHHLFSELGQDFKVLI
jgi:hypothetical protein